MTKALLMKASALREGDKVVLSDGSIATITKNTPTTYTIPKKKVKSNRLFFEMGTRINGKKAKSYPHATFASDEEFELVSRKGAAWKASQHWDKVDKPTAACLGTTLVIASLTAPLDWGGGLAVLIVGAAISGCIYWRRGF